MKNKYKIENSIELLLSTFTELSQYYLEDEL